MKTKTEKQRIQQILKENKIVSKVTISENRIDIKYEKDFGRVVELFPNMGVTYGFLN